MSTNCLFSCFLLLLTIFPPANAYGVLDTLEEATGSLLDRVFLKPFLDLINPANYVRVVHKAGGDVIRSLAVKLSAGDEVLNVANSKVPEIIPYHGYPVETHPIHTQDGYKLELHRIPHGAEGDEEPKRGVVILGHGLLCSSACWIFLGPNNSLPYLLADLGYDVWLANLRGNTYGRQHATYSPDTDYRFWRFTFHEMGMYDLPAIIDYVSAITSEEQVIFIGHSVSTTAFYVMCSERPEYNAKIKAHVSLAPMAHMKHLKNPVLYFLSQFVSVWDTIGHLIGHDEFLPDNQFLVRLGGSLCGVSELGKILCSNPMLVLCGFNTQQLNETLIPIIFGHTPAGTSLRLMIHYGQLVSQFRDRFQYFNHGMANLYHYGALFPPVYALSNVTVPSYCFYATNDWLVNSKDAKKTCKSLGGLKETFAIDEDDWNHNDFVYAINAREVIFDKIINILDQYD